MITFDSSFFCRDAGNAKWPRSRGRGHWRYQSWSAFVSHGRPTADPDEATAPRRNSDNNNRSRIAVRSSSGFAVLGHVRVGCSHRTRPVAFRPTPCTASVCGDLARIFMQRRDRQEGSLPRRDLDHTAGRLPHVASSPRRSYPCPRRPPPPGAPGLPCRLGTHAIRGAAAAWTGLPPPTRSYLKRGPTPWQRSRYSRPPPDPTAEMPRLGSRRGTAISTSWISPRTSGRFGSGVRSRAGWASPSSPTERTS